MMPTVTETCRTCQLAQQGEGCSAAPGPGTCWKSRRWLSSPCLYCSREKWLGDSCRKNWVREALVTLGWVAKILAWKSSANSSSRDCRGDKHMCWGVILQWDQQLPPLSSSQRSPESGDRAGAGKAEAPLEQSSEGRRDKKLSHPSLNLQSMTPDFITPKFTKRLGRYHHNG